MVLPALPSLLNPSDLPPFYHRRFFEKTDRFFEVEASRRSPDRNPTAAPTMGGKMIGILEIWDHGQGFEDGKESLEAYSRFTAYLNLGPDRSISRLSLLLGVSRSSLSETSSRYGWRQRAESWDAQQRGELRQPLPPPPPVFSQSIEPEIVGERLASEEAVDQLDEMVAYRNAFRAAGKEMLQEASNAQRMAELVRLTLMGMWEFSQKALENEDVTAATAATRSLVEMTNCYWKVIEARCKLTSEARLHWGDSAAIHELLREVYGAGGGRG